MECMEREMFQHLSNDLNRIKKNILNKEFEAAAFHLGQLTANVAMILHKIDESCENCDCQEGCD